MDIKLMLEDLIKNSEFEDINYNVSIKKELSTDNNIYTIVKINKGSISVRIHYNVIIEMVSERIELDNHTVSFNRPIIKEIKFFQFDDYLFKGLFISHNNDFFGLRKLLIEHGLPNNEIVYKLNDMAENVINPYVVNEIYKSLRLF